LKISRAPAHNRGGVLTDLKNTRRRRARPVRVESA